MPFDSRVTFGQLETTVCYISWQNMMITGICSVHRAAVTPFECQLAGHDNSGGYNKCVRLGARERGATAAEEKSLNPRSIRPSQKHCEPPGTMGSRGDNQLVRVTATSLVCALSSQLGLACSSRPHTRNACLCRVGKLWKQACLLFKTRLLQPDGSLYCNWCLGMILPMAHTALVTPCVSTTQSRLVNQPQAAVLEFSGTSVAGTTWE